MVWHIWRMAGKLLRIELFYSRTSSSTFGSYIYIIYVWNSFKLYLCPQKNYIKHKTTLLKYLPSEFPRTSVDARLFSLSLFILMLIVLAITWPWPIRLTPECKEHEYIQWWLENIIQVKISLDNVVTSRGKILRYTWMILNFLVDIFMQRYRSFKNTSIDVKSSEWLPLSCQKICHKNTTWLYHIRQLLLWHETCPIYKTQTFYNVIRQSAICTFLETTNNQNILLSDRREIKAAKRVISRKARKVKKVFGNDAK